MLVGSWVEIRECLLMGAGFLSGEVKALLNSGDGFTSLEYAMELCCIA